MAFGSAERGEWTTQYITMGSLHPELPQKQQDNEGKRKVVTYV